MKHADIVKHGFMWWALLLPLALLLIMYGGSGIIAVLRFVLESLDSFGGA